MSDGFICWFLIAMAVGLTVWLAIAHHQRDEARNRLRQVSNEYGGYREKAQEIRDDAEQARRNRLRD